MPGTIAHLIINLETADGYTSNSIVPIQIGTPTVYDPVGPDDYGYYIYDNEDINYVLAPTYNWVEIDAREGGPGTHLNSLTDGGNNQDDVETINLPFTFTHSMDKTMIKSVYAQMDGLLWGRQAWNPFVITRFQVLEDHRP